MMGLFEHFPYTNFHELNLGWFLDKFKALLAEWGIYQPIFEGIRDEAEAAAEDAAEALAAAETAQGAAETALAQANTAITTANTAVTEAQTARVGAETAQAGAEAALDGAEDAWTGAQDALTDAVTAKNAALAAQTAAETAADVAEAAQNAAEDAQTAAESAQYAAELAEGNAAHSANQAEDAADRAEAAADLFPDPPATDGVYTTKVTVTNGVPSYGWGQILYVHVDSNSTLDRTWNEIYQALTSGQLSYTHEAVQNNVTLLPIVSAYTDNLTYFILVPGVTYTTSSPNGYPVMN